MKPGVEAVDEALDIDCFYDWKLAVDVRKIINRQRFFYLFKNFTRSYKNSDRTKRRMVADKMVWKKWYKDKMLLDKMVGTKWYTDKMLLDKMVWTKWYGQNGSSFQNRL